jgi:hypothetical protein
MLCEDEKEDVSSYRMTLRKRENIGILQEEPLDHALWITRFGRGYGPVARGAMQGD